MRYAVLNQPERGSFQLWRGMLAGASASLIGIGLARFAYTPLLPAIIGAHWFPASTAAYLGAANLGGYLAGALAAGWLARHARAATVLRAMMVLATVAFVACAFPVSFLWFFVWRFLSGISGGALMVLAAPTIIAHVAPSRRGFASGDDRAVAA
jgi:MFS family permease